MAFLRPRVRRLTLADFRSFAQARCDIDAQLVALTGDNGAGKTNTLEALSIFSVGRGLRRAEMADWLVLLMHGATLPVTWICSVSGDWIDSSGGAKGRGLVSLGAFAWRVTVEAATARLLAMHGYRKGHHHAAA